MKHTYLVTVQSLELDQDGVPVETLDYLASFSTEQNRFSLQHSYDSFVGDHFNVVNWQETKIQCDTTESPHWVLSEYTEIKDEF